MNVSTETLVAQPALVEPVRRWWSLTLPQLWAFVAVAFTALFLEGKLLSVDLAYQVRGFGLFLTKPRQSKTEGRHFLSDMVVQVAGEPLAFGLLGLRNALKRLISGKRIEGVDR